MDGRRFITVTEAAEVYSMHYKTILALCRARKIPHTRMPSVSGGRGQIRIDRVGCDKMLEGGLVLPAEAQPLDRRRTR
ncbi:MAG: hypothetical protein IMZ57_11870 [Acidobacteria bacterium]|nr:hypothetical protein [Acidobacteriota bacterium]